MPNYRLLKDNKVVNTIIAESTFIDTIRDEYDSIEEILQTVGDVEPFIEPSRTWDAYDVRSKLSLSEKVIWDNDSNPAVITAKIELRNPKQLSEVEPILNFLVSQNVISENTKANVLA